MFTGWSRSKSLSDSCFFPMEKLFYHPLSVFSTVDNESASPDAWMLCYLPD